MRAASLFGVFVVAKAAVLAEHSVPLSGWVPIAYLWQDLVVVLLFAVLDLALRRPAVGWSAYVVICLYTAINVPVARALGTPLTWPMIRAAGGPLADSIVSYLTLSNVLLVLTVLGAAAVFPCLFSRASPRLLALCGAVLVPPLVIMGPWASVRVDTLGLHRNILAVLLPTTPSRIASEEFLLNGDERRSPFPTEAGEDDTTLNATAPGCNVILVALESTAARYLGLYGAADDPMPNLTRLAEHALVFDHAYTTYPESIKGLFAVLCSTYPALATEPELYENIRPPSLADVLSQAGYRTGLFHSGRFAYLGMESVVQRRGFQTLEDAGDIGGDHHSSFGIDDERITVRRIFEWIDALPRDRDANRPHKFFLTYLPIAGHHPYSSPGPGPFPMEAPIDRYRNALHHADAALGELWRGLQERDLDRNTLFVIYGDHGEAFGQHRGNFAHTLFIYEENVRVPLLIAAPGLWHAPVRMQRVASLIDISPTVLKLLGLPRPESYQGRLLLDGEPRMALFFTDYSLHLVGLRDERWKFIHEIQGGRSKLFDLRQDPEELQDVAEQYPQRVAAYRQHLSRWLASQQNYVTK